MNKLFTVAVAAAALTFTSASANASTLILSGVSTVHSDAPTAIIHDGSYATGNVKVSPQTLTGTLDSAAVSIFSYCVDLYQSSGAGTYSVGSLLSYLNNDTAKYNKIAALISAQGAQGTTQHDAAVQLGIWELMYETNPTLNVTANSSFESNLTDAGAATLANSYLSAAVANASIAHPGLSLFVAHSGTKQDMLFWTQAPVPEPATWAMMIIGFAAVGRAMRYNRRQASVSFA